MDLRLQMIRVARTLHGQGLAAGTAGNLSVRTMGSILTTPSGSHKAFLEPDDLIECDSEGRPFKSDLRPTSEMGLHLAAYQARPEIAAVIHAHPPLVTALTVAEQKVRSEVLPEAVACLGPIPLASYARPGSPEGARTVKPFLKTNDVIVLDRHGCLCLGRDLISALAKVEELEHLARVIITARLLGRVKTLSPAQQEELTALGRSLGLIK